MAALVKIVQDNNTEIQPKEIWLAGVAMIGLGVAIELPVLRVSDLFDDSTIIQMAPVISIVAGCIVFVVSFFGCCGAIKESQCMLVTYAFFMILLAVLKVTLIALIVIKHDDFLDGLSRLLTESFINDPLDFQNIERIFVCCGPLGPASYLNVTLPDSCCLRPVCTVLNSFKGCDKVIEDFFYVIGLATIIIAGIVAVFEVKTSVFT
ncbi:23 kDa integral membrane protein-like [Nymphalis io]|uniref:23 kDa integral membrane protein-like n=1 Tax=Inachis io TaxID=171585 RepID=UPI002169B485|nr:23 kDa integral membrane protein-like [Nymphalis io]